VIPSTASRPPTSYRRVWLLLFLAWTVAYADRSITGPMVSWMIANRVGFLATGYPYALGGIIGSMFFAGYMLTQFPAGYLGDRYGRKALIVVSTLWSGVLTAASAAATSVLAFVGFRVATGLGEGAYYSNDRALVRLVTPERERALGMGVVFVGLATGLTFATIATVPILDGAAALWGADAAWRAVFLLFAVPTAAVGLLFWRAVRVREEPAANLPEGIRLRTAALRLGSVSAVFLAVLLATYALTEPLVVAGGSNLGFARILQAVAVITVAFVLIGVIYARLGRVSAPVLKDRNLLLMYVSAIAILWTLWLFGFWSGQILTETANTSQVVGWAFAGAFGIANGIGYPLGGWISDRSFARGIGRRRLCALLAGTTALLVFALAAYVHLGPSNVVLLGALLFAIGLPFAAMQTVHMTMTSDLAPVALQAQAFGAWNLIAEIGAVLSPVVGGVLRETTGTWTLALVLNAGILVACAVLVLLVRERFGGEPHPGVSIR
jgi:MFS transporter, ACS family, D-galactonate transporter